MRASESNSTRESIRGRQRTGSLVLRAGLCPARVCPARVCPARVCPGRFRVDAWSAMALGAAIDREGEKPWLAAKTQKNAQKPQSRRRMGNPKNICGFCVLLFAFVVKRVSSSGNRQDLQDLQDCFSSPSSCKSCKSCLFPSLQGGAHCDMNDSSEEVERTLVWSLRRNRL